VLPMAGCEILAVKPSVVKINERAA